MNNVLKFARRVMNRIVNRPSQVEKRRYQELLKVLQPLHTPQKSGGGNRILSLY